MPPHKNMLEAFRSVEDGGETSPAPPSPPPAAGGSRGPTGPPREFPLRSGGVPVPAWMGWIVAVVVAFALGVLVGRSGGGEPADETLAAAPTEAPASATAEPRESTPRPEDVPAAPAQAGEPGTAPADPDAALRDAANRFTIVVVTYGKSGVDMAWATHDHLVDEGVPAFTPRRVGDDLIVVLAGAAPTADGLEDLLKRIQGLSRDGRRGVYGDAYVVRKDPYVD